MPRIKKQRSSQHENGRGALPAEVLTLADAATYLRITSEDVVRLVREQGLPGRQIGQDWRFLKPALQDWLKTGPTKKGLLQLAGAIKNDSHVDDLLKEVYRQRGRPE